MALTEKQLKRLQPRAKRYVAWDGPGGVRGFGVRVSSKTRTYVLKYRLRSGGRVRWKSYGRVGDVTLDEARRRAKRDVGRVADDVDPLAQRDADRDAVSFSTVCDEFLDDYVKALRKPSTLRSYRLAVNGHLRPAFGARAVTSIVSSDIEKLHRRLKATPYHANRIVATASKLFAWATPKYRTGPNPCLGVEKFKEQSRRRYLSAAELKRLGAALRVGEKYGALSPAAVAAVRLLIFTGCRSGEILSLRRDAVDMDARLLRLAETKTGRREIVLNGPAFEVLKAWPKFKGSEYVFPVDARTKEPENGHRADLKDPWQWIRRRARLQDVRLHDLRHSFASVAISGKETLYIVGSLLGHSQAKTTERYAHLQYDPLRSASEATGATIAASLNRTPR